MKAVSPLGGGQRGKLKVTAGAVAVVAALMLMAALVTGGCGGNAGNGSSGSQLDDEAAGASGGGTGNNGVASQTDGAGTAGEGTVMAGYSWDQCLADMTARYGSEDAAREVCSSVQDSYSASPRSELAGVLKVVENSLGVTPVNPSVPGGTGGGTTTTGGGTGGGTGGTADSGWGGIEIVVPPAP